MKVRAFDACRKDPWAIMPDSLESILNITEMHTNGEEIDLNAVAKQIGRPLDNTRTITVRDGVAIIPVSGPIFRFASLFDDISGATSVETLAKDFSEALANDEVKAILFDANSPGGQVSGIKEFSQQIFDARGQKPIVTYTGDLNASAMYWLGSASDKIFAAETARIGSIGVVAAFDDNSKAKERAGIREFKFISSQSPKKQANPATKEGAKDIQIMVDDLATIFLSDVARNRGVSVETVASDFGKGSVMLAEKALQAGMIDGISSFEAVLESLANNKEIETKNQPKIRTNTNNTEAKTMANEETPKTPEATKQVVNWEFLNANHAGLVGEIKAEGAMSERARIQSIEAAAIPGHESLMKAAIDDGKTTAGDFALQLLGAEKEVRRGAISSIEADAVEPVKQVDDAQAAVPAKTVKVNENMTTKEKIKAEWDANAELREDFIGGFDAYSMAREAELGGQVKSLKNKAE